MDVFFSNTDINTLQSEGSDMNHFVSLIVNNAGKCSAGITRKVKLKQTVNEEFTYRTWEDNVISGDGTLTAEKEYIQWFGLDIEIEKSNNDFEAEMLERVEAIRSSKANKRNIKSVEYPHYGKYTTASYGSLEDRGIFNSIKEEGEEGKQPTLFDNTDDEFIIDYEEVKLDEEIVDWVVKQTITCSVVIPNSSNIDIDKWARSMDSLYKKRFRNKLEFEAFASNFVDFIVNYTEDPEAVAFLDSTEMSAVLAYQVKEKLSILPKNEWLDIWIKLYDDYIL